MNTNKILLTAWVLIFGTYIAYGQTNPIQENAIAKVLFKNVKSNLTITEKNEIAKLSGLKLSKDKKKFIEPEDGVGGFYEVDCYPILLNNDMSEEICILEGGSMFGNTGSHFVIYTTYGTGKYHPIIDLVASPAVIKQISNGFYDLMPGGSGMEQPIWKIDGKEYQFYKTMNDNEASKLQTLTVDELSKNYQSKIK